LLVNSISGAGWYSALWKELGLSHQQRLICAFLLMAENNSMCLRTLLMCEPDRKHYKPISLKIEVLPHF